MLTSPSISARHLLVLEAVTAIAYVASAIACDWHDNAVPWSASATVIGLFAAGLLVRKTDRSLDAALAAALIGAVLLRVIGLIFQLRDLFRNQFPRCERGSCFASRARDGDAWFCYESEARCVSHNPDSPACTAMCSNLETDGGPVELTCYVYFSRYDGGARRLGFESEQALEKIFNNDAEAFGTAEQEALRLSERLLEHVRGMWNARRAPAKLRREEREALDIGRGVAAVTCAARWLFTPRVDGPNHEANRCVSCGAQCGQLTASRVLRQPVCW